MARAGLRDGVRASHLRIDPEIELGAGPDDGGALTAALRASGWLPAPAIQPVSTRLIDLRADEAALWGDLRKKWRQYVNKARAGGVVVVDAGPERLDEFYRIYRETADRAGFLIRARSAYRDAWDAYAPDGRARLLFAQLPGGEPVATLFLVRSGTRVVEPYGGMTPAGADSRANYLLKWEAIRSSREAGATTYDLWGLAHAGIDHFKTGFGGREIRYVGAWDLVLDAFGRRTFAVAQRARVRVERMRHGLRGQGGTTAAGYGGDAGGDAVATRERARPGAGSRRAGRLGRRGRRRARRPRAPVSCLGRAPRGGGLVGEVPRGRGRAGPRARAPLAAGRWRFRVHAARAGGGRHAVDGG